MIDEEKYINMGWNLDNTYTSLPKLFFSNVSLDKVEKSKLVILNDELAQYLGLNTDNLKSLEGVEILSGNKKIENGEYIAQAYAGHQFGYFTMLGDGRALLIGEQITPLGKKYDIQLKGSGKTKYSRGGDGKAVLGPMLREYIISEAMYGLGIQTTRSLAVIKTGESVIREEIKQGAILARIASSHIRFGTFQYANHFGEKDDIKKLANYTLKRHFSYIKDDESKYINLLNEVVKIYAGLIPKWQSVGFIHGVMNTDNMSISGETIDYGPCAFMDIYNPDTVFSSIDRNGRYSYKNQPVMAEWNLCRFAESLLPILHENTEEAIKIAQDAVSQFAKLYHENWMNKMRAKLGIFNEEDEEEDEYIIKELLNVMQKYGEDYTNTFIALTLDKFSEKGMFLSVEFNNWYNKWQERLKRQSQNIDEVKHLMKNNNPAVIPRNHRVEKAIEEAERGNFKTMRKLLDILKNPYEYSKEQEEYSKSPKASKYPYKTFCGT